MKNTTSQPSAARSAQITPPSELAIIGACARGENGVTIEMVRAKRAAAYARAKMQAKCADIVRKHYPTLPR